MAFNGDLTNISLFDVFQTLNSNQQTGVLVLQRAGVTKKIFISPEGVRIFFTRSGRHLRLGEIFIKRGRVSAQDVEILLMQQKQDYRPLGELLVESGKVTEQEMEHTLRYHAEDEIYEMFGWETGTFSFFDGETDVDHANTPLSEVLLDPGHLCLEAARRLDAMERLRELVPSNADFFVQSGAEIDRDMNSPSAVAVFDALVEPMDVDELRDMVGMSLQNVLTALVQLVEDNLVRSLELAELVEEGRKSRVLADYDRAAKLLGLAHERDPSDSAVLEDCVRVLEHLDDPKRLAAMLAKLGVARARAGDYGTAVDQLERALRQAPGNTEALIALRDCFAALGDGERAAEVSLRIARSCAEEQDIDGAVEACRTGLEISPNAIALRFYYATLLARSDEKVLAQAELHELIESTREQKRALRNRKTRELLASCYRLLIRLDPEDEFAAKGLRELVRHSGENIRRRRLIMRSAVAAAALLLTSAIGLSLMPDSVEDLLAQAYELREQGDLEGMEGLFDRITEEFPDSPEAQKVMSIRTQLTSVDRRKAQAALRTQQKQAETTYQPRYEQLLAALESGNIKTAAGMLEQELKYLKDAGTDLDALQLEHLRSKYLVGLRYGIEKFFERARKEIEGDIRYVSGAELSLRDPELHARELANIVKRLSRIRQSDWPDAGGSIDGSIGQALETGLIDELKIDAEKLQVFFRARKGSFTHLDRVYYRAKSLELKSKIRLAQEDARTVGRELLAQCEFEKARRIYQTVLDYASSASEAGNREHYQEVLDWINQLNIEGVARRSLNDIDEVMRSLEDVEEFKKRGEADKAYRLMRSLIKEHRLIQFERRYKLPYRVVTRPAGAVVFVNDKEAGRSPCAIEMEIIEPTIVRVEAAGFESVERRLEIADSSLDGRLDVSLAKVKAWEQSLRGSPEARPVMAGSLVLVPTNEASLLALRTTDGGKEWEAKTEMLDRIKATPLTDGKCAHFVTIGGQYVRVSLATGAIEKQFRLNGEVQRDGVIINGTLYFATRNRKLIAIRDGKVLFEKPIAFDPVTALHRFGEELMVGTAEGYVLFHSLADGSETRRLQSADRSSFFGGICLFGDLVVGAAEDGYLYAFEPRERETAWRYRMTGNLSSSPIAAGKFVFLPSKEGFMWKINVLGKKQGQIDFRKSMNGPPIVHKGFLYAPAGSRVIAHDVTTGAGWWEVAYEDEKPIHVAAGDRVVVVVTDVGRVVAYPADTR
ncbi:MAG: DUF4388 domain-containing protein [Planctomycetota bacterium]|jgi:tetratricopeptide (TPR) repeat protein/outer membrane protein assembly factor BamB